MNEQLRAECEAFGDFIVAVRAAAAVLVQAALQAWGAIQDFFATIGKQLTRVWYTFRAAHRIPRQYRDTMARRKIRRYYVSLR